MAFIHSTFNPVISGDVDIFSLPPTNTTVESSFYGEYKPLVNITDCNSKIEFRIVGNANQYVDLHDSFVYIRCQIVRKDGNNLLKTDEVSTVNLFMHSLFSHVEILVNNHSISDNTNCYGYKSYLETILSYSKNTLQNHGSCPMFYKDTDSTNTNTNSGYKERQQIISESKPFEMVDKLKLDMMYQQRFVLSDTNLNIVFTRNSDCFALLYTKDAKVGDIDPIVKFLDMSLFIRKQVLFPSIVLSHQRLLTGGHKAKYPIKRSNVKFFTIPNGNQSFVEENIFSGSIPQRMIVGLVTNKAFNGSYDTNPFCFAPNNISNISVCVNNVPLPIRPLKLDFAKNQFLLAYYMLFSATGIAGADDSLFISQVDFKTNYCLFAFDLCPQKNSEPFLILENHGAVRMEIQFSSALAEAMNCIVYSENQNVIELDQYRQPSVS